MMRIHCCVNIDYALVRAIEDYAVKSGISFDDAVSVLIAAKLIEETKRPSVN